jgi:pimeloyl-ACP methyl ester carboxylesterase
VLVHGGFADSRQWSAVLPTLAQHRAVITVDHRGHGEAGPYSGPHTIADDITDLTDILTNLAESAEVFAHSAGCHTALGAALRGAPIQHLVLYEAPTPRDPVIDDDVWQRLDEAAARDDRQEIVRIALNDVVGRSTGQLLPAPAFTAMRASPFGAMLLDDALSIPTELRALEDHTWPDDDLRTLATRPNTGRRSRKPTVQPSLLRPPRRTHLRDPADQTRGRPHHTHRRPHRGTRPAAMTRPQPTPPQGPAQATARPDDLLAVLIVVQHPRPSPTRPSKVAARWSCDR